MAAQAAVVLTDATSPTPVNRSFAPRGVVNGLATWQYIAGGILKGYNTLTQFLRSPVRGSDASKLTVKLVIPVLEVTSPSTSTGIQPAPTLAYELLANVEFVIPSRASLQERKDLYAMTKDLLTESIVQKGVEDLEPVWGG